MFLIVEIKDVKRIVSGGELRPAHNILYTLKGNYPSLKTLVITKKTIKGFNDYLEDRIKCCKKDLIFFNNQREEFNLEIYENAHIWGKK